MNIQSVFVLISGLVSIYIYSRVILPIAYGLWKEIHGVLAEQMAGAGLAEILVLVLADVIGAVSIMGGGGFVFVAGTVAFVRGLPRG